MLGAFFTAVVVAAAIKLVFAVCGHRVTWRLAFLLVLLLAVCVSAYAAR